MQTEVTPLLVHQAAERIRPIAQRTPVLSSHSFDAEAGLSAFFKCENFQKGGAFKIRGASNLVFSLPKADLAKGLIAYSSGNHAQATAIAARHVGAACTIVMPLDAPRSKLEATRGDFEDVGAPGWKIEIEAAAAEVVAVPLVRRDGIHEVTQVDATSRQVLVGQPDVTLSRRRAVVGDDE